MKSAKTDRKGKRVGLVDVAREAGVSTATVSRILSNASSRVPISAATRKIVLETIERLQYRPNLLARGLRSAKSMLIGLIVADIQDSYFAQIIAGVEKALAETGYAYLISSAKDKPQFERTCAEQFLQQRVDGLMLAGTPVNFDDLAIARIAEAQIPLSLIGRTFDAPPFFPSVTIDNRRGGALAGRHFLEFGHRRFAYITGPQGRLDSDLRFRGFAEALQEAGISAPEIVSEKGGAFHADGYAAMTRLLSRPSRPTAVFCYNDTLAIGGLAAARDANLSVPGGLSVIGFDNIDAAEFTNPPLTTITQPTFDMGYEGAKSVMECIDRRESTGRQLVLPCHFVARKSTGQAPKD